MHEIMPQHTYAWVKIVCVREHSLVCVCVRLQTCLSF